MTEEVMETLRSELEKATAAMRREMSHTRTGRASTALLEGIFVDYYGARTPLNQLSGISAPEPRLLVIQPYDKSVLSQIEKAILQSDLGLVPVNDGKILRVPIPELTEERRRELVKHIRKVGEDFKVSIRNHRREALDMFKELEKEKEITQDDLRHAHDKVQEITDKYIEQIDQSLKKKEQEIMEV